MIRLVKIEIELPEDVLTDYINGVNTLNGLVENKIPGTAKIQKEPLKGRRAELGWKVLEAMERFTGKQIPTENL